MYLLNQSFPQFLENFLNVFQAVGEQLSTFEVINSDKVYKVSLMPILLVADTPAKYSVLNWISHIGYYGCCYCFNKGERFVRRSESSSHNFVHCVESIVTTHRTSDKEATDWLKLIRLVVPDLNIPAFKTLKKRHTESMQNKIALQKKTANGE